MSFKIPPIVQDVLERAGWTFVATFVAAAEYTAGMHVEDIKWLASADVALGAAIFSTLKSIVVTKLPIGTPGTASAVKLDNLG